MRYRAYFISVPGRAIQPVGGFVLPAEAPTYTAMFIITAVAAGIATIVFARNRFP